MNRVFKNHNPPYSSVTTIFKENLSLAKINIKQSDSIIPDKAGNNNCFAFCFKKLLKSFEKEDIEKYPQISINNGI
nr:hypothetical protein [Prevotella phocaeensis]